MSPSAATSRTRLVADNWHGYGPAVPVPARFYDALLGGKDNFPADRAAASAAARIVPAAPVIAAATRHFAVNAVTTAAICGVTQFLDLGAGLPLPLDLHDAAREVTTASRLVYVDTDPEVATHSRALRVGELTGFTAADLASPDAVLSSPAVTRLLDFTRPVAVIMSAALHWCPGDIAPVAAAYKDACPPGSWLVISHAVTDGLAPGRLARLTEVHTDGPSGFHPRPATAVAGLFSGWRLLEPGVLTDVRDWPGPPREPAVSRRQIRLLCGIAVKP